MTFPLVRYKSLIGIKGIIAAEEQAEVFLDDHDGDGQIEVIAGINDVGADQGYVIDFEQQPKGEWVETWRFNTYQESPYGCRQCANRHNITGIQLSSSSKRSTNKKIIAVSHDANSSSKRKGGC